MTKRITIIEVKDYVGQEVTIGAAPTNQVEENQFLLQLRDLDCFSQGVLLKPNLSKNSAKKCLEKFDI